MPTQIERICEIYRCSYKDGMYLYVDQKEGLNNLPKVLIKKIGQPELAMTLTITAETNLARANAEIILDAINSQGFYLQMPATLNDYMQEVNKENYLLGKEKNK